MADLNKRDRKALEVYFGMSSGYVLDFSNRTFTEFFDEFGVDIDDVQFEQNYPSDSKANRLRGFWDLADNTLVGKVLLGLIEYYDDYRSNSYHDTKEHNEEMRNKCIVLGTQLNEGTYNASQVIGSNLNASIKKEPRTANTLGSSWQPSQRQPYKQAPTTGGSKMFQKVLDQGVQQQITDIRDKSMKKQKVFIVHGHDEVLRLNVENFIRKVGLEPIVLQDQANGGNTIIEKIEEYSDVDYAVILYSQCDEGRKQGEVQLNPRARQNVVFEHGYFIAKLGRKKVAAMVEPDIEIQNDIQGVVYIATDTDWRSQLLKELKKAGVTFDANQLYA